MKSGGEALRIKRKSPAACLPGPTSKESVQWRTAARRGPASWRSPGPERSTNTGPRVDAAAAKYLELLTVALEDGKIIGDEGKALAGVAGGGGMGAEQVRGLNVRFLEVMREAACVDQVTDNRGAPRT